MVLQFSRERLMRVAKPEKCIIVVDSEGISGKKQAAKEKIGKNN